MIKDYIIIEKLGQGNFGVVYKVKKKNTNNIFALKQISFRGLTNDEINQVKKEAKILQLINSDFVVKYYDSFEENNNMNIVMEYCDGGDLNDFIKDKKDKGKLIEEELIWKIFIKITIGLADIHKINILHRDLKTLNVFLKKSCDIDIKIGDLGVAKIISKNTLAKTIIGTPYYLSPEICEEKPYNDKSDVWALGCILYELCSFKHPFEARSQGALIVKILNNKPEQIDAHYSNDLKNLVFLLLDKNSDKRLSCIEILKSNMALNKIKKLGLYEYLIKLDKNNHNNHNNVKISKKILDLKNININKKLYSNNISKENIHKNVHNGNHIIKNLNNKKHISAVNLIDNIKNNNLKFNQINQQIIHKKKNSEIKINVITIENFNNPKSTNNDNNNNNQKKNSFFKYNNFFISNSDKNKNIKNEKVIISKKNNKINNQNNQDIITKKIIKSQPIKIINKNNNEFPQKVNNYINSKNNNINNNKKDDFIIKNEKNINNIPKYKFIEKENKNNGIPIKINQINSKYSHINNQKDNHSNISITKNDMYQNSNNNKKTKENYQQKNINKNVNLIITNQNSNKKNLISILQKKNKTSNENKSLNKNNTKNDSIDNGNNGMKNVKEKKLLPNFIIINNNIQKENNDNNKNIIINQFEDSIDEYIIDNNKVCFNPGMNKEKNINNNDNRDSDEEEEENVKLIKGNYNTDNLRNKNKVQIETNKEIIINEINKLKEKTQKNKNEMLKIIGEKDYMYIMNQYNICIKEPNKVDDIYEKIEDYANKNYTQEKKEKFIDCYLFMIGTDIELGKKIENLKNSF